MEWINLLQENRPRVSASKSGDDLRTEFEKDYHRIIGSAAFRRLQDKTQVFPLDKSDFIRTRLTHSLEVSSFAKSLGQRVGNRILRDKLDASFTEQMKEDMIHILECAGLVHDIGNPPFGHFGEVAIRAWFKDHLESMHYKGKPIKDYFSQDMIQDFLNYDGNAAGLRLLTKLHFLVDEYGMNLTYGLLGTIIKYPKSSIEIDKDSDNISYRKLGYFTSDKEIFENIEKECGLNYRRHPLTYLLEAADDIAYKTADIEDGFKKRFIRYDDLLSEFENLEMDYMDEYADVYMSSEILNKYYRRALKEGIENPEEYAVCNWAINTQTYLLKVATDGFVNNYESIMSGEFKYDIFYGSFAEKLMKLLRDIGWNYIFDTSFIYKLEVRSWHIYEFLLKKFTRACLYFDTDLAYEKLSPIDNKIFTMLESRYLRAYKQFSKDKSEGEKLYLRMIMVLDYISGMTDSKALRLYQELNGIVEP